MWTTITAVLRYVDEHASSLGMVGTGFAAVVVAAWTAYLRWSDTRRRRPESPGSSGQTRPEPGGQADLRQAAPTSDPPNNPFRARVVAETLFRAISGGVVGFLLVPLLFLYGGWFLALVFGAAFAFCGLLITGNGGEAFWSGVVVGSFCFLTGVPGGFAAHWGKPDKSRGDDARDGVVGALIGAAFGAVVLSCVGRAMHEAVGPAASSLVVVAAGAVVGGISGVVAAILPNQR